MSLPPPAVWRLLPSPPMIGPSASQNPMSAVQSLAASTDLSTSTNPNLLAHMTALNSIGNASAASSNKNKSSTTTTTTTTTSCQHKHVTLHPVLPWVAYVMEGEDVFMTGSTSNNANKQINIIVQDLNTQSIVYNVNWTDVAACLYGERNSSKLQAATKSLGNIVNIRFVDTSTLFWSGMSIPTLANNKQTSSSIDATNNNSSSPPNFSWLSVQTTSRILVLQLRKTQHSSAVILTPYSSASGSSPLGQYANKLTRQAYFISHVHEKALGATPSSNLLAIDTNTWLIGCSDGTLKAWDKTSHQPVKSIKGLGKGDWIVKILPANKYSNQSCGGTGIDASGLTATRRILTITKKGSVYLIELEFLIGVTPAGGSGGGAQQNSTAAMLEIRPPLARFSADSSIISGKDKSDQQQSSGSGTGGMMDHGSMVQYDAHRDWIMWHVPARKGITPITTVLVWNLQILQKEFVAKHDESSSSGSKSGSGIFKPDPTLTIHFPAESSDGDGSSLSGMTVLPTIQHASFADSSTVVCGVATETGDFYLQVASATSRRGGTETINTTSIATPVMGVNLAQLLERDLSLEVESGVGEDDNNANRPIVRIYAIRSQPLGDRSIVLCVTNVGLVALDVEVSALNGPRRLHFGPGLGSLGKSVLSVQHSEVIYGSLDVLTANPMGLMEPKNPTTVYESPPALHLPDEYRKRQFRLMPLFSVSPSGLYCCLFWSNEFRYEILHIPSLLQKVGQRGGSASATRNPLVAAGTGVIGFAWLGDEDDYALIHAEDLMEEAILLMATAPVLVVPTAEGGLTMANLNIADLMDVQKAAKATLSSTLNVTKAATNVTLSATKAATNVTLNATKATADITLNAAKAGLDVTTATVKGTLAATGTVTKAATKGVKKSLRLFGLKKKKRGEGGGISEETEEEDVEEIADPLALANLQQELEAQMLAQSADASAAEKANKRHYVELRTLISVDTSSSDSIAAATSSGLGEMSLRGGNRNPPTLVFGGPVLIVASRSSEDQQGHAHFYTRKPDEQEKSASVYVSTGPTLPYPEIVAWDDDGRLCAVVVANRVAIYLSSLPSFVLLGAVRLDKSNSRIVHVKFVHGVLYCCSWNAVYCVFLGDLSGGVCMMDTFMLASSVVPGVHEKPINPNEYKSFSPPVIPLPLAQPFVLGYQSGSLLLSTVRGVQSIPLCHPLLRIGTLLGAGQVERAVKWFDAVPNRDHEALSEFLQRRGHANLALQLPGLSLETIVDISMRNGYVDRLEEVVEDYGVKGLRLIDMGRGVSPSIFGPERHTHSVVVCVGAYLLAHGKVELTRRLATELLRYGEDGKKDALFLATLLLTVDETDASRLMARAVEDDGKMSDEWLIGTFVRDHVLRRH